MAASPQEMQKMMQPGPGAQPPQGMGGKPSAGPAAAGMMNPTVPTGSIEGGKADVHSATKVLMKAASVFKDGSKEKEAVLQAIMSLQKVFGGDKGKQEELMPAEIAQLIGSLSGPGPVPQGMPKAPPGQPPQPIQ